jgi:hypothetical protein
MAVASAIIMTPTKMQMTFSSRHRQTLGLMLDAPAAAAAAAAFFLVLDEVSLDRPA